MRTTTLIAILATTGCSATIDTASDPSAEVFHSDALARFDLGDRAFVMGHALGVLYFTKTVPTHTANTGFTYQAGLSSPKANVPYQWTNVIADPTAASLASTSGCNFDTCSGSGGSGSGGDGGGSGSGSGGGACETFLQPAADDAKGVIARLDLEMVMGPDYAGNTAQYQARFQAGVDEALASEDQADLDHGVEMGPVRDQAIADNLCTHSPLVLDLDGVGLEASAVDAGVQFDLLGTGHAVRTAWPTTGALLVLDRDGDGMITSGKELFGNGTGAGNGFAELAAFDQPSAGGNGDGVIDRRDAVFSQLKVWRDRDRDAISQPGELTTLSANGITEISLAYQTSDDRDRFGNPLHERGTFVRANASTGAVVDVWFRYAAR